MLEVSFLMQKASLRLSENNLQSPKRTTRSHHFVLDLEEIILLQIEKATCCNDESFNANGTLANFRVYELRI